MTPCRQLKNISDFDVLYTDFTEIFYKRGQVKAPLIPIIDHTSKLVVGHALEEKRRHRTFFRSPEEGTRPAQETRKKAQRYHHSSRSVWSLYCA